MRAHFLAAALLAVGSQADDVNATSLGLVKCKCFPGDVCWPSSSDWNSLNQTVGGRLIATVPLAQACHDPNYDPVRCQALRDGWKNPATQ
jgi:hypothetical protein